MKSVSLRAEGEGRGGGWPRISRKLDSNREIRGRDKFSGRREEFRCFRYSALTTLPRALHSLLPSMQAP